MAPSPYRLYVGFCKENTESDVSGTHWLLILDPLGRSNGTWWHTLPTHDNDYELRKENTKNLDHSSIVLKQWVADIPVCELGHVQYMMMHDVPMQHSQRWVVAVLVALERKFLVPPGTSSQFMKQIQCHHGRAVGGYERSHLGFGHIVIGFRA
ncbi:uncharacterized protein N7477_008225 [Penicillium maclennaniae]|uniref:uncharacterized protein n=1 Tax=Penicillium maclennaniae TaxID=1343394 RepID=UPI002540F850|nr:uncharacterized protein N7477_008225 [Penicillium maclennaniae]KAJ5665777.1 hypothetical protein N7477_008225 [Penicillium maclennaniae]